MTALRAFIVSALGAGGVLAGFHAVPRAAIRAAPVRLEAAVLPDGASVVARPAGSSLTVYRSARGARPFVRLSATTIGRNPRVLLVSKIAGAWTQLWLPVRPNGTRGWARTAQLRLARDDWRVRIRLRAHRLDVLRLGRLTLSARIAEGAPRTPTPRGRLFVTELLRQPDPRGLYGPWAFALSGFSPVLTSFNGGRGEIGMHGTNEPWLLGRNVSHGCIRLDNRDIVRLARTLPLGTPVEIS